MKIVMIAIAISFLTVLLGAQGFRAGCRRPIPQHTEIYRVVKNGSPAVSLTLYWHAPAADQYGNPVSVSIYKVYRGLLAPEFKAEKLIGTTHDLNFTDVTAFNAIGGQAVSYFYRVYAVPVEGMPEYGRNVPRDKSTLVQWQVNAFSSAGFVRLSRRDIPPEVLQPGGNLTPGGLALVDVENFSFGSADTDIPLVMKFDQDSYTSTVSHSGAYIGTGYSMLSADDGALNVIDPGAATGVPVPAAVRVGDTVTVTWAAAAGPVVGYRVYRSVYHCGEIGSIMIDDPDGASATDGIGDVAAGHLIVYTIRIRYSDGTISEHSGNSGIITK